MEKIEPEITKKGITVWFDYPFSWQFVESCRNAGVRWDGDSKRRYIKFGNATLPLSADRVINNYKTIFAYYNSATVKMFKTVMDSLLKLKNNVHPITSRPVDLSNYPELFLHQKTGIQFLEDRKGLAILADEQGLGKTKTTCVWLIKSQFTKVLIVTPLSARFVWRNELMTLGVPDNFINIAEKDLAGKYVIINYDKLKKFQKMFLTLKFDCVIFDEAHLLKNKSSQRFKVAEKISRKSPRVICATGTPVSNRPIEIFPLLRLIKAPLGKNITEFADRYCDRKLVSHGCGQHYDMNGASNLDELSEKLKTHMIRRLKKDCLDLPTKLYTKYYLKLNVKEQDQYDKIYDEYINKLLKEKKDIYNVHLAYLTLLRSFCSKQKFRYMEEYIKDAIESGEKILIFGCFTEPLNKLYEKYKDCSVIITSKTNKKNEREEITDKFQNDPRIKIFFGQIKAAGTALTLTEGQKVIFNDLSWNPTDHSQSEDRINRIGSKYTANIIYPLFKDTIEEDVYKLLKSKELLINTMMEKTELHHKEENIINELIRKFNKIAGLPTEGN